jgi:tetratricopeptide (TPR) repeat protein
VALNPAFTPALRGRGDVYRRKGQLDRAIAEYSRAIASNPTNAFLFAFRGDVFNAKGDLDRAIADYDKALSIAPGNPQFQQSKRVAMATRSELTKLTPPPTAPAPKAVATVPVTRSATPPPPTAVATVPVGRNAVPPSAAAATPSWIQGWNTTSPSIAGAPNSAAAQLSPARMAFAQASLLFQQHKFDETIAALDRAITADPKLAAAYQLRAFARMNKQQHPEALADFNAAIGAG